MKSEPDWDWSLAEPEAATLSTQRLTITTNVFRRGNEETPVFLSAVFTMRLADRLDFDLHKANILKLPFAICGWVVEFISDQFVPGLGQG